MASVHKLDFLTERFRLIRLARELHNPEALLARPIVSPNSGGGKVKSKSRPPMSLEVVDLREEVPRALRAANAAVLQEDKDRLARRMNGLSNRVEVALGHRPEPIQALCPVCHEEQLIVDGDGVVCGNCQSFWHADDLIAHYVGEGS